MKKNTLAIMLSIASQFGIAQAIKPFNFIPKDLGTDQDIGILTKVASNQKNIIFLGRGPIAKRPLNKYSHPIIIRTDYEGKSLGSEIILDSTISEAPFWNEPILHLNDSVIIYTVNFNDTITKDYGIFEIIKMNINSGQILTKAKFYNSADNQSPNILSSTQLKNGRFQLGVIDYSSKPYVNHIYDVDTGLNVLNHFILSYSSLNTVLVRWVSRENNSNYEVITDTYEKLNDIPTGKCFMRYDKIDKEGRTLKSNKLLLNIIGWTGDIYAIMRDSLGNFIIGGQEVGFDSLNNALMPYVLKISPEFDSILKVTKMYPYEKLRDFPRYMIYFMDKTNDNTGYLFCGDISSVPHPVAPQEFGLIFKVNNNADSLWSRKYIPLNWDSSRVGQCNFKMIHSTEYNSILVSAYVGDRADGWLHPWLIQLDQFGCFVPGCDKAVSNSDILSGKEKAFMIYPNPVQDKLFLLSRITADHLNMQLLNIQGDKVLQNKISVSEGVQYINDIPETLASSIYILQIMDEKGKVWMSEKITKI